MQLIVYLNILKILPKNGFDPRSLNKDMLTNEFEKMLGNMANGDESYYDASY